MTMRVCRDVIAFLADYLSGELPPETMSDFEEHIAGCRSCTAYIESYRETIRLAKDAHEIADEPPAELVDAILAAVRRG